MAFNVGDRVIEIHYEGDGIQTVEFGPYQACDGGVNRYVVKRENGYARELSETVLKAVPKFKAGDRIKVDNHGKVFEIAYGPFDTIGGSGRYLVRDGNGVHRYAGGECLTLVEPSKPEVGDRVRILGETRRYAGEDAGRTGVLKEIDVSDPSLPYLVEIDGASYWFHSVEKI